jgi:hypothetical protein
MDNSGGEGFFCFSEAERAITNELPLKAFEEVVGT